MRFDNSNALVERARQVIAGQTMTLSKSAQWFPQGAFPLYIERGEGPFVWDVDGNKYCDFILGLGPITLGYNHPEVNTAIREQLDKGIIFSLPHPLEIEVSEQIQELIPCAERVRFSKTGSEVCQAAVRVARAYTGRNHIAFRGYSGWHEWYACISDRPKGTIPEAKNYMHEFKYNDLQSLDAILSTYDCAAVIMEPVIFDAPEEGYLQAVKDLAHKYGALLIFDEMVTGFRMAVGGAQDYFKVTPDLATFGKGIANGMPLSVLCGKADVMDECNEIFFSGTFHGECLSLAAAKVSLRLLETDGIKAIWEAGGYLRQLLERRGIETVGYSCRFGIPLKNETKELRSLFMQECAKRGLLIHSFALNICAAHHDRELLTMAADMIYEAYDFAMLCQKQGTIERELKGKVINPPFRRF